MRPIGGYFELELSCDHAFPHQDGALVNSGRCALEYLLMGIAGMLEDGAGTPLTPSQGLSRRADTRGEDAPHPSQGLTRRDDTRGEDAPHPSQGRIRKLYIPSYTCEVVLEPLQRLGIPYEFYDVSSNLEVGYTGKMPVLLDGEYILVNNYFGIKDAYIEELCQRLAGHVIVDNSQAFFTPQYNGQTTFWSPRKFVGVPDGGIAMPVYDIDITERDQSYDRCSHLLKRWDLGASGGYEDFHANSATLKGQPVKRMSQLTEALLRSIDYDRVIARRKANYTLLRDALEPTNLLSTPSASEIACPMVYPYMTDDRTLRQRLISHQVFVAKYWPNCDNVDGASALADKILPLPIDQRYELDEIKKEIEIISNGIR